MKRQAPTPATQRSHRDRRARGALTARTVLRTLVRTRVRDDGSCWAYAVLACCGLLDHAKQSPFRAAYRADPTPRDRRLDAAIREKLSARCSASAPTDKAVSESERLCLERGGLIRVCPSAVLKGPDYDGCRDDGDFFGSYGGTDHLVGLADLLGVDVALWDEGNDGAESCTLHTPAGASRVTVAEVLRLEGLEVGTRHRHIVHMAWSRDIIAHFEAYVRQPAFALDPPEWLRRVYEGGSLAAESHSKSVSAGTTRR